MTVYVRRNGKMVNKNTGEPMVTPEMMAQPVKVPMIISDIEPYTSPVDGRVVNSRSDRRDDLKRHGCVEYEPSMSPTKGKIRNKAFAAKRGLQVSEEFR